MKALSFSASSGLQQPSVQNVRNRMHHAAESDVHFGRNPVDYFISRLQANTLRRTDKENWEQATYAETQGKGIPIQRFVDSLNDDLAHGRFQVISKHPKRRIIIGGILFDVNCQTLKSETIRDEKKYTATKLPSGIQLELHADRWSEPLGKWFWDGKATLNDETNQVHSELAAWIEDTPPALHQSVLRLFEQMLKLTDAD